MRIVAAVFCLLLVAASGPESHASPRSATAAVAPRAELGAKLYAQYCRTCHGARLEGHAADNAPSLSSPTFRKTASDKFLRIAIARGRAGTAMAGYGKSFGGPLAPADIDALIAYIRAGTAPTPLPRRRAKGDVATGGRIYAEKCQRCHGTAEQRASAVHLANPMFLATASDAYLRQAIVHGRPGTAMQAWSGTLSSPEIEDVVAYVRSLARAVPPTPSVPPGTGARGTLAVENVPVVLNPTGARAEFTLREDRYVSVAAVANAYDAKRRLVLVDARTPSDYLRMHIAGAISVPYFDMHDLAKIPNDGTWVIAYCACPHHVSGIVMEELRKRGYAHSAVLDEGIFAWQQQGHPVIAAAGQLPIAAPPPLTVAPMAMPKHLDDGLAPAPR
jgi:cytochrome c oxidase cbb3-type subunit 3